MNILRKCLGSILVLALIGLFFTVVHWAQEGDLCPQQTGDFSESFDTTAYKDPFTSVDHWGEGYITLNKLGSNFDITNPQYIPVWINTVAAGDFDLDGWPDLIGSSSSYSNVLAFVKNQGVIGQIGTFEITHWIDGSDGVGGWPTQGVNGAPIDNSGHCGMTCGDYDDDGDLDFLFIASNQNSPNSPKRIWLYENEIADTGVLSFTKIDKTGAWSASLAGIAWSATMMISLDFDGDGDLDILMGNRLGNVVLIRNNHKNNLDHSLMFTVLPIISTGWGGLGVSTISCADFDLDGDNDLVVGSVSYGDLRYYKNDGSGNFTLYTTYQSPSWDGAATVSIADDFDKDGDIDLVIGTDNWNYKPGAEDIGGQAYYFRNQGGDFISSWHFDRRPEVYDFDLGIYWDYDKDGDNDFLIADGNHSEKYYLFINNLADVYNLSGTALSTNITPGLDQQQHAITKVQITNIDQLVIGGSSLGLAVEIFVSNNNGTNWEFYARFEESDIRNYTDLHVHTFNHYGAELRWKAVLTAEDDQIANQPPASYETPEIDQIDFEYTYVERREYSRTSVAATISTESGSDIKLIIGGTFYYPGWQGHLRAYDVTNMSALNTSYTELRTVTRPDPAEPSGREIVAAGVEILWDAGLKLDERSAGSRNIYTALPDVGGGMNRIDFDTSNEALLAALLSDVNSDNEGLINFVRGEGRYWKLGDINHSNPVVIGAPSGTPGSMGPGYDEFKDSWEDRREVLYVGANDGMIHCIDLLTGDELWGYIPFNILPRLTDMWAVDAATGDRYFLRQVFVDGSPVVADIQIEGNWRTILICGQGSGKGSVVGGSVTGNYYFALDVTDPFSPQPLWEFSDDTMGETWSIPVIGRVSKEGDTWAAFMGSGYDNYADGTVGNRFYAVDVATGEKFWQFNAGEVDTIAEHGFSWNIQNTIPGSPSLADSDVNGYTDSVYIPDLDGRIWKIDTSIPFTDIDSWSAAILYEDAHNYPIVTKPEVWINPFIQGSQPRLYFGTGGDDQAPDDGTYSFVALMDNGAAEQSERVEWYLGDPDGLGLDAEKQVGVLGFGEKVWSDPQIGDFIVYFNTLTGSIESVDPCVNIEGIGKLYGRFVVSKAGSVVGSSAFRTASGNVESLNLSIKTRSAVTLGEESQTESGIKKRDVYIQEYDSTIQKLEQITGGLLKVKSWREIYQIIKQ
ncbi:MAG: VCBS repeat-containing protein [Candidatus Aminicenantes bacterium]|nr:VCBS repeat-containing protein [Candidatus Aminicenantes bacterium]